MSTATVVTTVETVTLFALLVIRLAKNSVASDEVVILTILFPTKMVEISLS